MAHRTREEVFAWAAAETAAGRRPSLAEMAEWGTDYTLDRPLSRNTVASWIRRKHDPRDPTDTDADGAGRGVHSTAHTPAHTRTHTDDPDKHTSTTPASEGVCTTDRDGIRHFPGLTPLQERAVLLKAGGMKHAPLARELGIHRSTVIEWLRLPAFASALSELRTEAAIAAREGLTAGAQEAIAGTREVMRVMLAIVHSDAVALSPNDLRILEAGEQCRPIIDPRLQIQAARVLIQASRSLMDRGGFHPKSELHLTGEGDGGVGEDFSTVGDGELEEDLEEELAGLDEDEQLLRLIEGGG